MKDDYLVENIIKLLPFSDDIIDEFYSFNILEQKFIVFLLKGYDTLESYSSVYLNKDEKIKTIHKKSSLALYKKLEIFIKKCRLFIYNYFIDNSIMDKNEALKRLSHLSRASFVDLVNFRTIEQEIDGKIIKQAVWDIPDSIEQEKDKLEWISELSAVRGQLRIKIHDPKIAIQQLSKILGWEEPSKSIYIHDKYENIDEDELNERIVHLQSLLNNEDNLL